MKKNQKHTREEMYEHVVRWEVSGLSQKRHSEWEGFLLTTFSHWIIKYRKQAQIPKTVKAKPFIPVEITAHAITIIMPGRQSVYRCKVKKE